MQNQQPFYGSQPGAPDYSQYGYGAPGAAPMVHPQPSAQGGQGDGVDGFFSSVATNLGPIGNTFTFIQGGQHYVQQVQQSMGFLSGSALNYHFAISKEYVRTKVLMVLAPYLGRWNYSRVPEQIPGGPKYRPPRADVNCPDLYIPLMAFFTYILMASIPKVQSNEFTPEVMYTKAYRGLVGWACHAIVIKGVVMAMSLPSSISMVESACYSGYVFVLLCLNAVAVISKVNFAGLGACIYSSLCMAVFLVKSFKRHIHNEARHYGGDPSRYNYLLLILALVQIPFVYFMAP
ncbi:hypothetical protein BSKO_10991 [Bryopsis sp. KO-2023]|nr:hypothetical protein BSKO_10991 [Bryopsis sp. KO-2023]